MASEAQPPVSRGWKSGSVYTMASLCLVLGVALGYLFRGSESRIVPASQAAHPSEPSAPSGMQAGMPTLDQMKHMADKQAEPLLAKLKNDPRNPTLLNQVGTIYKATHQFKEAIEYYQKALDADPKNVGARTDLASCLYYEGDIDGALNQLQQSLTYTPNDANSLFNLGIIRWKGKGDAKGAVEAWAQLLKSNPEIAGGKKKEVESLMAEARGEIGKH